MIITFYIHFHTNVGQELLLSGNIAMLGSQETAGAKQMTYLNEETWTYTVELPDNADDLISYKYLLKEPDGTVIFDGEDNRVVDLSDIRAEQTTVIDAWNADSYVENVYFSRPFSKVLLTPVPEIESSVPGSYTHEFRVKAPLLGEAEVICLLGSSKNLRYWDTGKPVLMATENNWFVARVTLEGGGLPVTYKYGIYNTKDERFVRFEEQENRSVQPAKSQALTIIHDGFVRIPTPRQWRGAGIAIPVFSLRSKQGFGVGEFSDLLLLVDWAKRVGMKLIQILPVNDTIATRTWMDSYPYAAISAFALHPLYINLEKVAGKEHADIVKRLKKKKKQLNDLSAFDYEQVMKFKMDALKEMYAVAKKQFKDDTGYFSFFELNREWLVPYAVFSCLRDKYETSDFTKWKTLKNYDEESVLRYASPRKKHYDDIAFYYFVQYHLHLQMKEVITYAHKNKVILKGDIPIGVYRYGCDAWANPKLYNMHEQAGAPPDDFAVTGQNWGFPTYNWEVMGRNGFKWWRNRFDQMSMYFDAFRIDHILGFFRIWSIPVEQTQGIMGRFQPAIPVDISEFQQRDIWFDHFRYCHPFITDEILWQSYPNEAAYIIEKCLEPGANRWYSLKKAFSTQRRVDAYFDSHKVSNGSAIREALKSLITNVILLDEKDAEGKFHFRFGIEQTSSFQQLEHHTRQKLKDLYVNYFYSRQEDLWRREAMKKLPQLKHSTRMLVCGEDLGMVPNCVPQVMQQLGILSLEIQRMPKDPNVDFFHPKNASYMSVVTPSTHDMSTIRGWWEEDRATIQHFYNYVLGHYGEAPYFCEAWINNEIVLQHLYSPAMWSIFQVQDLLGTDKKLRLENPHNERINIPADPNHYWRYRLHLPLEKLLKEDEFNDGVKKMVTESGRG